ncbi:MAG: ribokinase [Alphaproteobacteria bacterium]|nr:ribokinase [Alphaproteobacteria bacterium]MBU1551508.1 ribokinase [Alphaproteobacteria bacterium]MBU2337243.1 ribokinase [Alphaproteobacteria bacterium]MBU2387986.1 ribokinase [Alphaproteobacteria bacterium]
MIITFGSVNVDFVFEVEDMPQSGQTLLAKKFRMEPGGKGANQALAAARDGAEVVMVGAVGNDSLADTGLQNLAAAMDITRVARVMQPTGNASIHVDCNGRNMIVVAAGANLVASSDAVEEELLQRANVVLLQMENDVLEVEKLICRAAASNATAILNLAPAFQLDERLLSLCDIIVLNEDEADALAGWLCCEASARMLAARLGTGVLRTLGGDGAEAFVGDEHVRVPAMRIDVKDTTAAGDCFVGVLASALDRGLPLKAAMERASVAASLACSQKGSQSSIPERWDTDQLSNR